MNSPITSSCIAVDLEKQRVLLTKRLIRVRSVRCFRWGRIAPRGAARAQVLRSAARRGPVSGRAAYSRPPLAAASAESEGPNLPISRRERVRVLGGSVFMTDPTLGCHTTGLSSGVGGEAASEWASLILVHHPIPYSRSASRLLPLCFQEF